MKSKCCQYILRSMYVLVFLLLVFFSPLKKAIFSFDFPKNFAINIFEKKEKNILPSPVLITPITEINESLYGRNAIPEATIKIFINQKEYPSYKLKADQNGNFRQPISESKLVPGDLVWVKQYPQCKISHMSPAYNVLNSKLISWYEEKEKNMISTLEDVVNILLSWSVLIIGGFIYLLLRKYLRLVFLLIPILFCFILSIYYGISCRLHLLNTIDEGISVLKLPLLHMSLWKQTQLFEQGIFICAILVLWNLSDLYKKKDEAEKIHKNKKRKRK